MRVYRFLDAALLEYEDAVEYYEREAGLGTAFDRDVQRGLALLLEFPYMGTQVLDTPPDLDVRRLLVRRFGVEIDYLVADDTLVVLAIFHGRRRPGYWLERLDRLRRR